jgi:hypothetical protein
MEKWNTMHQMGAQLCKEQVSDKQINGAQANRICKIVCVSIAERGWRKTRKRLSSMILNDSFTNSLSDEQIVTTVSILKGWFRCYWCPFSKVRKSGVKELIGRYK